MQTRSDLGVSTATTTTSEDIYFLYNYEKLLEMKEEWSTFFTLQRGLQLATPYIFEQIIHVAMAGMLGLTYVYVS